MKPHPKPRKYWAVELRKGNSLLKMDMALFKNRGDAMQYSFKNEKVFPVYVIAYELTRNN